MKKSFFNLYSLTMAILIASYLFIPEAWPIHIAWQVGIGWLAGGAIVAAVRHNQLSPAIAWWFCAAAIFLNAAGIGVDYLSRDYFCYTENNFPCAADGFWLMLFPNLVIGLSILAHRRAAGKDWSAIIDAAIVMTGLSLLSWVFIVSVNTQNSALTMTGLFVVIAYPLGDLAVLGVMLRFLLQGNRNTSLLYISLSLGLFLIGDSFWAIAFRYDLVPEGFRLTLLETVFLLAYVFLGAGAVHPSSRNITAPIHESTSGVSSNLLILLAVTSLVPSTLLLYQSINGGVTNGIAIALSSGGLFLLVMIRIVGLLRTLESQAKQLIEFSRIDDLTGLPNRRAWMEELTHSFERAYRHQKPFSVALIDLDKFKIFNDTFGHQAGDNLLKDAAKAWRNVVRLPEILGRYGGEEFILILQNTTPEEAITLLERLRPLTPDKQTFSCGLARWDGTETIERLLLRADQALYRAKAEGRNRTVID